MLKVNDCKTSPVMQSCEIVEISYEWASTTVRTSTHTCLREWFSINCTPPVQHSNSCWSKCGELDREAWQKVNTKGGRCMQMEVEELVRMDGGRKVLREYFALVEGTQGERPEKRDS